MSDNAAASLLCAIGTFFIRLKIGETFFFGFSAVNPSREELLCELAVWFRQYPSLRFLNLAFDVLVGIKMFQFVDESIVYEFRFSFCFRFYGNQINGF